MFGREMFNFHGENLRGLSQFHTDNVPQSMANIDILVTYGIST